MNKNQRKIYEKIDNFLKLYSKYYNLEAKVVYLKYINFLNNYINDCKIFEEKKYPQELDNIKNP